MTLGLRVAEPKLPWLVYLELGSSRSAEAPLQHCATLPAAKIRVSLSIPQIEESLRIAMT